MTSPWSQSAPRAARDPRANMAGTDGDFTFPTPTTNCGSKLNPNYTPLSSSGVYNASLHRRNRSRDSADGKAWSEEPTVEELFADPRMWRALKILGFGVIVTVVLLLY